MDTEAHKVYSFNYLETIIQDTPVQVQATPFCVKPYYTIKFLFIMVYSNDISEMDQLGYLGLCVSLKAITLEGNPLATRLLEETVFCKVQITPSVYIYN